MTNSFSKFAHQVTIGNLTNRQIQTKITTFSIFKTIIKKSEQNQPEQTTQ